MRGWKKLLDFCVRFPVSPSCGNGRDVSELAKSIARSIFQSAGEGDGHFIVIMNGFHIHLSSFLRERQKRETTSSLPLSLAHSQAPVAESTPTMKPVKLLSTTSMETVSRNMPKPPQRRRQKLQASSQVSQSKPRSRTQQTSSSIAMKRSASRT